MALKALAGERLEIDKWVVRGSVDFVAYRERQRKAASKKKAPAGAIRAFPAAASSIRAPSPMVESRAGSRVPSASAKSSRAPSVAAKSLGPSRAPSQSGSVLVAREPNVAEQEEAKDGESSGPDEFGGFGDDVMEGVEVAKSEPEVEEDEVDKDEAEVDEGVPEVSHSGGPSVH